MDRYDDQNASFEGSEISQKQITTTRPKCLADGIIPWIASQIESVPMEQIKQPNRAMRRHFKR